MNIYQRLGDLIRIYQLKEKKMLEDNVTPPIGSNVTSELKC